MQADPLSDTEVYSHRGRTGGFVTGFGTCGGAGCAGLAGARPPANPALARLAADVFSPMSP